MRMASVDITKQSQAIMKICDANHTLHPNIKITRVVWRKRALLQGKPFSSLIVDLVTADMTNRIIKEGLIYKGEFHTCERLHREATLTQCFNCQSYGHIQRACHNKVVCGLCAGAHLSRSCPKEAEKTRKCKLCKGDHFVWLTQCIARQNEFERIHNVKQFSASLFQQEKSVVTIPPPSSSTENQSSQSGDEE
jgi:hypothetical protein